MNTAERHTQVRNFVQDVWNGRNYEAAADLYADSYVDPFGTGPSARAEPIRRYHAAFPDLRVEIDELTGREMQTWFVDIMHFNGDRVVSEWIGADNLGAFVQLGFVEDPWPK